jgi:hypothetical protein
MTVLRDQPAAGVIDVFHRLDAVEIVSKLKCQTTDRVKFSGCALFPRQKKKAPTSRGLVVLCLEAQKVSFTPIRMERPMESV